MCERIEINICSIGREAAELVFILRCQKCEFGQSDDYIFKLLLDLLSVLCTTQTERRRTVTFCETNANNYKLDFKH